MTIPREDGMVRLYVPLGTNAPPIGADCGSSHIVSIAQKILHPYTLSYKKCYWSSFYQVGQLLASSFSAHDRVFLVGDALHTHSPKAGQGLNVSIQDAYNLGWKLAAVSKGRAKPCLLDTYEKERRPIAEFLLRFDRDFQRFFHQPMAEVGFTIAEYRLALSEAVIIEHAELSGISACYIDESMLTKPLCVRQDLATGIYIGKRIPNAVVVNQADGRGRDLHDLLQSNGKWRLLVFAGDITNPQLMDRYTSLGRDLLTPKSPLRTFTLLSKPQDDVFEVITVHRAPRHYLELLDLPSIYHPWNDDRGWDYDKVFVDCKTYHEDAGHAYSTYGVDSQHPCVVLVRPDQHVCMIFEPENLALSTIYLSQWLYWQNNTDLFTNGHVMTDHAKNGHSLGAYATGGHLAKGQLTNGPVTRVQIAEEHVKRSPDTNGHFVNGQNARFGLHDGLDIGGHLTNDHITKGSLTNGHVVNGQLANQDTINENNTDEKIELREEYASEKSIDIVVEAGP